MNGEMWKLYCEMGLLDSKLGQKEYMVVLPWMITYFKWRGKKIKALPYRIAETMCTWYHIIYLKFYSSKEGMITYF